MGGEDVVQPPGVACSSNPTRFISAHSNYLERASYRNGRRVKIFPSGRPSNVRFSRLKGAQHSCWILGSTGHCWGWSNFPSLWLWASFDDKATQAEIQKREGTMQQRPGQHTSPRTSTLLPKGLFFLGAGPACQVSGLQTNAATAPVLPNAWCFPRQRSLLHARCRECPPNKSTPLMMHGQVLKSKAPKQVKRSPPSVPGIGGDKWRTRARSGGCSRRAPGRKEPIHHQSKTELNTRPTSERSQRGRENTGWSAMMMPGRRSHARQGRGPGNHLLHGGARPARDWENLSTHRVLNEGPGKRLSQGRKWVGFFHSSGRAGMTRRVESRSYQHAIIKGGARVKSSSSQEPRPRMGGQNGRRSCWGVVEGVGCARKQPYETAILRQQLSRGRWYERQKA